MAALRPRSGVNVTIEFHQSNERIYKQLAAILLPETLELRLETTGRKWEFPKDRFVEYEKSDEAWARPLGFGKEVDTKVCIKIPNAYAVSVSPKSIDFECHGADYYDDPWGF